MEETEINKLKARAYDLISLLERAKAELQQVNQAIVAEMQKVKEPVKTPE